MGKYELCTFLIPLAIIAISYFYYRPIGRKGLVDFIANLLPRFYFYALLIYYLNMEGIFESGMAFLSVIFVLIPVTIVIYAVKFIKIIIKLTKL